MKNVLQYYYGLIPASIHQKGKQYIFEIEKNNYVFLPTDRSLEELNTIFEINNQLRERKIYTHEIILNNNNSIVTFVNQIPYVLLKTFVKKDEIIILNDIIYFQNNTILKQNYPNINRTDWYHLWAHKIDYFEYQVSQLSKKYPLIQESFSYFLGLAENGISLYKMLYQESKIEYTVSHKRVDSNSTLFDLYNPLNFIIDCKSRDASEYFKSLFLKKEDVINDIIYYLKYSNLTDYEAQLFFIRMLFPTFYFDVYEEVITGEYKEKELQKVIIYAQKYEILIKQIYQYLKSFIYLPEIEWINNFNFHY